MNIFARLIAKRHDTGLQRYTKNLSWMFFARIATMAIGLIATAYIARNLGPTSYGELSYAVSFVMLISVFASLGNDHASCLRRICNDSLYRCRICLFSTRCVSPCYFYYQHHTCLKLVYLTESGISGAG